MSGLKKMSGADENLGINFIAPKLSYKWNVGQVSSCRTTAPISHNCRTSGLSDKCVVACGTSFLLHFVELISLCTGVYPNWGPNWGTIGVPDNFTDQTYLAAASHWSRNDVSLID